MKYLLFSLAITYIIGAIMLFIFLNNTKVNNINDSIVIIIPEEKLIKYNLNPKGIIQNNKNYGIGSGFFISSTGLIQTVNHIISNNSINYKILYKNKFYNFDVISRDEINDLAILQIISKNNIKYPFLEIEKNIQKGSKLISYGVDIPKLKIISNTGILINKKIKLNKKLNLIEISNKLKPGFSGGPVVNLEGKVIGINYAISRGKNYIINLTN